MSGYLDHPQTQWLEMTEPEDDGLALLRPPWRFDGSRPRRTAPTPRVGEHSVEIAAEVCDESRIEELITSGVLYRAA
jgi:crotonobetainyl-CoA:carnitine CoA-transferase CaiB-like acyl-CoA transferase